jgi:hypothetical protein
MTVTYDPPSRRTNTSVASLEERFQVMKEVGDGSFGSVALARVRTAGAHIARRGTMVWTLIRKQQPSWVMTNLNTNRTILGRN